MTEPKSPQPSGTDLNRRDFLSILAGIGGAAVALQALDQLSLDPEQAVSNYEAQIQEFIYAEGTNLETLDVLERMRVELRRALGKTPAERRWVMVIDLRKCVGCHACTVACIAENKLPPGVVYRPVIEEEIGTYPNVARRFVPRPCMQCENPPCVPVCPVGATYTNEEGIVEMNYERCIGCRYCITACPYSARTADFGLTYTQGNANGDNLIMGSDIADNYERAPNFEYGKHYAREGGRKSPVGNARKCHFCQHRVMNGQLPACVTTCIGRATLFGDANDPDSLVAELIASPNVMRLREELGTEPRVYYLT
jgi:molybdopterin-containing oxidoreductase family iron-sulfur binding subunit